MSKPDDTAGLPAPLSLTLDEARQVAAGASGGFASMTVTPWWWFGQPADFLKQITASTNNPVANVTVGPLASRGG